MSLLNKLKAKAFSHGPLMGLISIVDVDKLLQESVQEINEELRQATWDFEHHDEEGGEFYYSDLLYDKEAMFIVREVLIGDE